MSIQNSEMNPFNYSSFHTHLSTQWPFANPLLDVHLCYCSFDTNSYTDDIYQKSGIKQPFSLKTASMKRKAEYLAGRICAKEALSKLNIMDYPISQQDRSPLWPSFSCGSITHSHTIAAAIVAQQKKWLSLGLDIEYLLTESRSQKLMSSIINDNEQRLIKKDIALFTTIAFSVKESLFKALYPLTQKRFYFKHAEIIDWGENGEIVLKLLIDLSSTWREGTVFKGSHCMKEGYIWSMVGINN